MGEYANFYNSTNGDRVYDADSFEEWLKPFFTTGVFNGGLQVNANVPNDMTIKVTSGYVNINGKTKFYDAPSVFTIEAAHATLKRIDNVILRRDDVNRDFTMFIQKGSFSETPSVPTITRANGLYDLVLAEVYVNNAAVVIRQENILDKRADLDLCGWVTSTVEEIDLSQITAQWLDYVTNFKNEQEADFMTWFNTMKDQLTTDAAGSLQTQINTLTSTDSNLQNQINTINNGINNPATTNTIGKVIIGDNIQVDANGKISLITDSIVNTNLLSANWTGTKPFTYELTVNGVNETSNQLVKPSASITEEQFDALSACKLLVSHQELNKIVFKALGDKPTINIPIEVTLKGGK